MNPVLFLVGAVALSLLGAMIVWLLNRPRKERFGSSIDSFHRDLDALAPPGSRPVEPTRRPSAPGPKPQDRAPSSAAPRRAPGPNPRQQG